MSELKPCPCCDADNPFKRAIPEVGIPSGDSGYRVTIKCRDCGCSITRWALKKAWAIESAEAAWNRRAQPDNLLTSTRRAKPANEPLTLEELREMYGEPVWTTNMYGEMGAWVIVGTSYASSPAEKLSYPMYDKTWLAYRRKPEGSKSDG